MASPRPKVTWPVSDTAGANQVRLPPADTEAGGEAKAAAGTWAGCGRAAERLGTAIITGIPQAWSRDRECP